MTWLSSREAGERLGLDRRQVCRLARAGQLTGTNPTGRGWIIEESSVDRLIAQRASQPFSSGNLALIDAHLDSLRLENFAAGTIYQRRNSIRRLLEHAGDVNLLEVTTGQIKARLAAITGPNGRKTELAHLRRFYEWAIDEELLEVNPTRRIRTPKLPRALPRPISEDDLARALLDAPSRVRPWLLLAGWAGLRCLEIAQLRAEDIAWDDDPPVLHVRMGKGAKDRVVPMAPFLVDQLRRCDLPTSGYLFVRRDGLDGHLPPHHVSHLGSQYLQSVGVNATMHQLRYRFGTQAHRATGDLRTTQELMGHSSPVSTAIYSFVDQGRQYAAVAALPSLGDGFDATAAG